MASKEACVASPSSNTLLSPCLERSESTQHLTSSTIPVTTSASASISACRHHSLDLENLGCGCSKKKCLSGHRTNFQKSIDQNQNFFPGLILPVNYTLLLYHEFYARTGIG